MSSLVSNNKKKGLHLATQARVLQKYFPQGKIWYPNTTTMIWEGCLQPTAFSIQYKVRILYELGNAPKVFVIEPEKLSLHPSKDKLEHVYDQKQQQLCLYYPVNQKWKSTDLIATTIMLWAAEWLYFYEIWLDIGEWKGGGRHV